MLLLISNLVNYNAVVRQFLRLNLERYRRNSLDEIR